MLPSSIFTAQMWCCLELLVYLTKLSVYFYFYLKIIIHSILEFTINAQNTSGNKWVEIQWINSKRKTVESQKNWHISSSPNVLFSQLSSIFLLFMSSGALQSDCNDIYFSCWRGFMSAGREQTGEWGLKVEERLYRFFLDTVCVRVCVSLVKACMFVRD